MNTTTFSAPCTSELFDEVKAVIVLPLALNITGKLLLSTNIVLSSCVKLKDAYLFFSVFVEELVPMCDQVVPVP